LKLGWIMRYPVLERFFKAYVSVKATANFMESLNEFMTEEKADMVRALQQELKALFTGGAEGDILELLRSSTNMKLEIEDMQLYRKQLTDMYKNIQAKLPSADKSKLYDVFISYSSIDREKATQLAFDLIHRGYRVWFDKWEILAGQSIVDEVFSGILESEFLIVILSKESCKSKWVQEELATGKLAEIERRRTTVIPVLLELCNIPAPLKSKKYADFTKSWADGLRVLTTSIEMHRMGLDQVSKTDLSVAKEMFSDLKKLESYINSEIRQSGFKEDTAYKKILMEPPDDFGVVVDKTELDDIVDGARVHLLRWGGSGFPYETGYPHVRRIPFQNGVRYLDTEAWPYSESSFHFWQIDDSLRFAHVSYIEEDQATDIDRKKVLAGTLGYEWILMDIVRPIVFAHNLLNSQKQVGSIGTLFIWNGLANRKLVTLNQSRVGFWDRYICQQNEWRYEAIVRLDSDLLEETRKASIDLFWLFGWKPKDLSTINKDLTTLIGGAMP
jgi:hypothetical protein